ncbi:MAG TPA: acylphosphatase [Thermodesulfobacteriota bacterium]|nr:acylphosphatase [Thermodesulfobacteriota bacterium]
MAQTRVHVWIKGRVQGVCFRAYTQEKAETLGLTGWVRNLVDGRVEVVFEGEEAGVREMVKWCHRGPSYAEVTEVTAVEEEYKGEFNCFSLRY